MKFEVIEKEDYTIIHFELESNISPEILQDLKPPEVDGRKGVILSGRGPIWLYGFLIHFYHPTKFVAIYDPRIGAIVVESHIKEKKAGDVIQL